MSNQVYSVPYGTVQLHDPTGLVRGGSTSNSNTNSAASGSHSNLGQSPTPSIEQQQQHHQHRHQQQHYQDQDQEEAEIDQDLEDDEVDLEPEDDPQDGEYDNSIESQQAAASGGRSRRKASVGAKKSGGGGKRAGSVTARKEKGLGRNGTPIGGLSEHDEITGRRKIKIQFVEDDNRRHVTFSKRKAGIMKKAYELATLTGTQVLLLIVSQTDQVFTFATPKLQRIVMETEGQVLIQNCLQAPDDDVPGVKRESGSETQGGQDDGEVEQESQLGVGGIGSQEELGSEYLRMNDEDEGSRGEAGRETSSPVPPPHKNSPKKANFNARIKTPKVPKAPKVPKPKKLTKTQLLALAQAQAQQVENERLERERIERERIENERANGTLSDPPPMIGRDRALTGGAIGSARDADEFNRPQKRSRDEMNEMVGGIGGHGHPYGSRENSSNVSLDLNLHSAGDGLEGYWNNAGGSGASGSGNSNGNAGVHQDHLSNSHSGNPNSQHQLPQLSHPHQHYQRPHSHSLSSVNPYQQQQQHLTGNHQSQFSSPQLSTSSSPIVSNHHWNGSNQTGPNGMGLNHPTLLNRNQGTMFGNGNGNGNQGDINVNVGAGYNGGNGSSGGDYGGWGA